MPYPLEHGDYLADAGTLAIYEYAVEYFDDQTGKLISTTLVGYSMGHAYQEATYECLGQILSIKRGQWLYNE